MAPAKRKRNERGSVDAGESRPSPHRPANTTLGQHEVREAGGRRSSRGNQGGGRGGRRNDRNDNNPNKLAISGRATPTPGPMSPPVRPPSAAQTPTQNLTPTFEPPSPIPKSDPAPYDYVFLIDERVASWSAAGRQEVIALGIQARQDEDTADLATAFQELLRAALDDRIDPTDAGSCVKEILGLSTAPEDDSTSNFDGPAFFLDIFSLFCDTEVPPVSPALRIFAAATGIPPSLFRQNLDEPVLFDLGLVRNTFKRMGVRYATQVLYRQANYNLLREETEGYSKLVNELFVAHPPDLPWSEVEVAFERVKGLIGTFDLDVGRVLDITLDVFAAVLIKQFRFFVRLLRLSSWWPRNDIPGSAPVGELLPAWALPNQIEDLALDEEQPSLDEAKKRRAKEEEAKAAEFRHRRDTLFWPRARAIGLDAFFELGGREVLDEQSRHRILGDKDSEDAEIDTDRQWVKVTGTLPPSGNRVAAQLLGFKLRFYASDARDNDDVLPANLLYLTALLIKIGFISLRDIYPHLWPLDEDMDAVRDKKRKELEEKERQNRPGGAINALMMAGALPDDTLPSNGRARETTTSKGDTETKTSIDAEDKDKLDEPVDQKVQLLTCLLTIGAIPESLFILGRFPWLTEAFPELIDRINRILLYSIEDVYVSMCSPVAVVRFEQSTKFVADSNQTGMPKGEVRLAPIPVKKQLRWPFPDSNDHEATSYRFYWDEWSDNVPVCQSVDDVFTLCGTLLNCSGVGIGKNPTLLSKLARIGNASLTEDTSPENHARWQDLLKRLLVPALSFTRSNTSVVNEIYDMLRHYPVSVRYSIYAEWFEGQISRMPAMKTAFARTTAETMAIMKRISMTNITIMARSLAKAAYASPGIVFRVALGQIEQYTNLTEVVVECAKYFTDLGYDVLVWSLMSSLGGKDRNRSSAEFALLPSQWLLALSRFAGKVFKRYSITNPSPILQYVNHQLHRGNSMDLQILKELIAQMSGIVPNTDFTDAQLAAMTGRENLQRITLINLQDKRYESVKTSKRFLKALADTRLAGELLISIAQYRQAAIYSIPDDEAHIKLLATMIDDTQNILLQYLDLLRSNFSVEEFDKHVPSIPDLLTDFGLQPALAFMIGRSSVLSEIAIVTTPKLNGISKTPPTSDALKIKATDAEGDVEMEKENKLATDANITDKEVPNGELKESTPTIQERSPSVPGDANVSSSSDKFQQCLEPIVSAIEGLHGEDAWQHLTPEFYVTFWITTLSEISVPKSSYEGAFQRLLAQENELSKPDRSDMTRPGITRRAEAKKAATDSKAAILREWNQHMEYAQKLKLRFSKRKNFWFNQVGRADILSDDILEKCLFPRLLLSPTDADFCFSIIKYMHDTGTPHFRLLSLYSRLFRTHRLRSIIFICTVREAESLGRFLRLVLNDLARWHASPALYEKEALGTPKQNLIGFAKSLDADGKPKGFLEHVGKSGFRNVLLAWHKNINSALRDCLDGHEWMHIRNAISVLKSVGEVFPAVDFMGNAFIKQLEGIAEREKDVREDLALTGNAVMVGLKKRSNKWVMVQAFGFSVVPPPKQDGTTTPSGEGTLTQRTSLKPTAPEFKPRPSSAQSTSASTPKRPTEVEDGEVDDAKTTGATSNLNAASKPEEVTKLPELAQPVAEPKKSEILIRREQFHRDNAAKAAASHSAHSTPPPRLEPSRPSSALGNSSLPSRPDAPFPSRQDLDRQPRHLERRDGRDSRLSDSNRLGRPADRPGDRIGDRPGDRPRDFASSERRGLEPNTRDFSRPSDRSAAPERTRPEPPPRWTPDSARDQDRFGGSNRGSEANFRLGRDTQMPPPRSNISSDRLSTVPSERLPPVNPDRQELINPERAALISTRDSPRGESPRQGRDDLRDRNTQRTQSPRRHVLEKDQADSRRDDRPPRYGPDESFTSSRSRLDESPLPPPAGPRSDRQLDRPIDRPSGDRLSFQPPPPQSRILDPDHGRLNPPPRSQVDPNFGRLNPAPVPDIPSGPRDRNSRGNRPPPLPASNSTPRRDGRPDSARAQSPPNQPPTGPSSGRHPRNSNSGQFDSNSASSPATTSNSATASSPVVGVHPDRLRQLPTQTQAPAPPQASSIPANTIPTPGMHPDRARAYGTDVPNSQHPNNRSWQPGPPISTAVPPSGPKNSQASPISGPANGIAAPTGPASAAERASRGGRRQLAGINTMLQQASSDRGIQVRGRGRVSAGGLADSPMQNLSPQIPPPPSGPPPSARPEPVLEVRDLIDPARADLISGNPPSNDDRDRERTRRREHSGRHSRRSSRSPGREREPKRNQGDEERPSRDHKERRGGDRSDERDRNPGGRSSPHPDLMSRESRGGNRTNERESNRDGNRGHERERERSDRPDREVVRVRENRERETRDLQQNDWNGERNDHRPAERGERGPERGGRTRDVRGDHRNEDRRDSRSNRGGDDGGRKRHSEEGMDPRGREKRPRRG